jgi:hypothetical protein
MHRSTRPVRRALLVPVLLFSLMLVGSVPAAAYTPPFQQTTGQIGPYDFRDMETHPAVDCDYRELSNGVRRIKHFKVRAPRVWWPDTNSDNDHQHGVVGWRFRIQKTTDPDDHPWSTVFTSSIQKRTAHEGAYDVAFKAPFAARNLDWSSGQTVYYRVKSTVYWFKGNGTVKGSISYWYTFFDASYGLTPMIGYCLNRISFI